MEQKTEEVWPNKSIEELAIDALWNIANYRIDIGPQMTAQSMRFTAADALTMISEARAALKAQPAPTEAAQGEDSARLDADCDCDSRDWCKNYNRCHRQVCGFPLRGTTPKPV